MGRDPHPFYVPPDHFHPDGTVLFPDDEARHILRVVRLAAGDTCRVVDGRGGRFRVRLAPAGRRLRGIVEEAAHEPAPARILELGFPSLRQQGRTEWLLEKAVEVGVDRLLPIRWAHTVKDPPQRANPRWMRILREAMKQSERAWLPSLEDVEPPGGGGSRARLVLADPEGDDRSPDLAGAATLRLLVGPEGGVTDEERADLLAHGAWLMSLGPTRLRAETAAVVGLHRLACALRATDNRNGAEGG